MAENISLVLTASTQGLIQGVHSQTTLERLNTIEVFALKNAMGTQFDRTSMQASSRRYYEPVTFTKGVDASTVKIRRAHATNERITSARFRWYRQAPGGTVAHFLTLLLEDAIITSSVLRLPDTMNPVTHTLPPLEDVSIAFNQITWTITDGGVEHSDMWNSRS